jgi:hypothetical protein
MVQTSAAPQRRRRALEARPKAEHKSNQRLGIEISGLSPIAPAKA